MSTTEGAEGLRERLAIVFEGLEDASHSIFGEHATDHPTVIRVRKALAQKDVILTAIGEKPAEPDYNGSWKCLDCGWVGEQDDSQCKNPDCLTPAETVEREGSQTEEAAERVAVEVGRGIANGEVDEKALAGDLVTLVAAACVEFDFDQKLAALTQATGQTEAGSYEERKAFAAGWCAHEEKPEGDAFQEWKKWTPEAIGETRTAEPVGGHTPTPWFIGEDLYVVYGNDAERTSSAVALTMWMEDCYDRPTSEYEANARLIVAAVNAFTTPQPSEPRTERECPCDKSKYAPLDKIVEAAHEHRGKPGTLCLYCAESTSL